MQLPTEVWFGLNCEQAANRREAEAMAANRVAEQESAKFGDERQRLAEVPFITLVTLSNDCYCNPQYRELTAVCAVLLTSPALRMLIGEVRRLCRYAPR